MQTSVSVYDPKGSPPAEASDLSRPQGMLVRDTSYASAGGYLFRFYSDTDVCIHNPVNINNREHVWFLLGNSPASEFYMPTFRNILSVLSP